ncbi:carbohydrate-binding module family 18 protein, partial [Zopfia rhizophila CBS 207.26]
TISQNGFCGGRTGQTCVGSAYCDCCSEYGYCGSTPAFCDARCQPSFGECS